MRPGSRRAALRLLLVLVLLAAGHRERAAAVTLSTSSRWIVDQAGHRVKLACVNWPSHLEPVVTEGLGRQPVGAIAGMVVSLGFNCVRLTYPIALATNASLSSLTVRQSLLAHGLAETAGGVEVNNPGFLDLTLMESFKAKPPPPYISYDNKSYDSCYRCSSSTSDDDLDCYATYPRAGCGERPGGEGRDGDPGQPREQAGVVLRRRRRQRVLRRQGL
jgi:hypothetical protein